MLVVRRGPYSRHICWTHLRVEYLPGEMLAASGRLSSDDLEEITEARVDCVLNKPFDIAEWLGAVGNCLANQKGV